MALLRTVLLRADKRVKRAERRFFAVFMIGSIISQWLSCRLCPHAFFFLGVAAYQAPAPLKNYPSSTMLLKQRLLISA